MMNLNEEFQRLNELIKDLEEQNKELRERLNAAYDFIHNTGNPNHFKTVETFRTYGNSNKE